MKKLWHLLRSLREKLVWCLKRQTCLHNPRLLFSYLVFFGFLYFTWTVLAAQDELLTTTTSGGGGGRTSLRPGTQQRRVQGNFFPPEQRVSVAGNETGWKSGAKSGSSVINGSSRAPRQLTHLRIPRNYTRPAPSFSPLLRGATSSGGPLILVQPASVPPDKVLLKSVAGVERKRRPVPQSPPQFKDASPYRVFKNYLGPPVRSRAAQAGGGNDSVTLATHATPNYLKYLVDLSRRWQGPMSVAVYAPGDDFALAVELIVYLRACFPTVRNSASFHLVFDADLAADDFPHHLNWVNASADCGGSSYERHSVLRPAPLAYPVNVARNVARACSKTKYVLVSDVELVPSADFGARFSAFLKVESTKGSVTARTDAVPGRSDANNQHRVYVLPVFEIAPGREVPRTKRDLVSMLKARTAFYFHSLVCPHCQRFPGLNQWISSEKPSDRIKVFAVTKREGIYQRWEPVYVGTKKDPFFDERLSWDGLQDKMSQALEMCLAGYRFAVLDSAFLVHRPALRPSPVLDGNADADVDMAAAGAGRGRKSLVAYNQNATGVIEAELRRKYPGAFRRGMCISDRESDDGAAEK